ncbi:NAD(P)H-hydrate dehydratase [Orrella sp. 11846]|uniref:NAD(P)H-hydrate dehydratase n=1 Tax=Orrella sp. 11846 TaxID=3409913 RepID=UPI003B58EF0E
MHTPQTHLSIPMIQPEDFADVFQPRDPSGHKGTHGSAAIYGGATGMTGAAILAARSALKSGSGRIYVCLAHDSNDAHNLQIDWAQPELMIRRLHDILGTKTPIQAWGIGCGLGHCPEVLITLRTLLSEISDQPKVLDADALNALARQDIDAHWDAQTTILTPHPGEAAYLLGCTVNDIQTDRLRSAQTIASKYQAWTVLKGQQTVVATPDGDCFINPTGHVALGTAGTGDVLTGFMTSLLAQGHTVQTAVFAAVWIHGAAGQWLAKHHGGPIGITASEVVEAIRYLLNHSEQLDEFNPVRKSQGLGFV